MLKWTWIMVAVAAGCSDPTGVLSDDPDESIPTEETGETTGATDETEGTGAETTGSVSDTGSGSGSATADTGSGTVDSDTVPACWLSCMSEKSGCQLGSVVIGRCPDAAWCCEPKVVDTETGTGTGTGVPCTGKCANTRNCGGDWIKIVGDCPLGNACCVPNTDTGSGTVDTDTNPQPCPTDDPKYSCEWRVHCEALMSYREDTDYFCNDPTNMACCRHPY